MKYKRQWGFNKKYKYIFFVYKGVGVWRPVMEAASLCQSSNSSWCYEPPGVLIFDFSFVLNPQVFSSSTFLFFMVFSFSILMIWFDDFWCYEPTGVFHFLLFFMLWTYKCFHFPLFLMSWTSRLYHFLFFLILWTSRCFHSHFRDPLFITILRFRFSWIFSSLGSLEILGLGLLLSGIIVWNWLARWCSRKPSTWILPSPLFLAIKYGVQYPWSHVLPGPLEFIKVHLLQLFPPGDVGLEVEAAPGKRDRDLPGFV